MKKSIAFNSNDVWPLINILNEVCHCIPRSFDSTNSQRDQVVNLLNRICEEEKEKKSLF